MNEIVGCFAVSNEIRCIQKPPWNMQKRELIHRADNIFVKPVEKYENDWMMNNEKLIMNAVPHIKKKKMEGFFSGQRKIVHQNS